MRTQKQIEQDLFILDCKDHWNNDDWKVYSKLRHELLQYLPKTQEPTQEEQEAREIARYAELGLKFIGKDENGTMNYVSEW